MKQIRGAHIRHNAPDNLANVQLKELDTFNPDKGWNSDTATGWLNFPRQTLAIYDYYKST